MDDKYTLRDLIVYFIAGFLFVTIFFITYDEYCSHKIDELDFLTGGFVILMIPIFYMIGHTVSALDSTILSRIGIWAFNLHCKRNSKFTSFFHELFNGHRIRGIGKDYWTYEEEFLTAVSKI